MTRPFLLLSSILILALCLFVGAAAALAHDFYDPWCCDGKDCKPYTGTVEVTRQGYYLPEFDTLIPFKNAYGSLGMAEEAGTRYNVPEDAAQYHICFWPESSRKVRCFYAKPGGV